MNPSGGTGTTAFVFTVPVNHYPQDISYTLKLSPDLGDASATITQSYNSELGGVYFTFIGNDLYLNETDDYVDAATTVSLSFSDGTTTEYALAEGVSQVKTNYIMQDFDSEEQGGRGLEFTDATWCSEPLSKFFSYDFIKEMDVLGNTSYNNITWDD